MTFLIREFYKMSSIIINNLKNIENFSYLELGVGDNLNFTSIKCKEKFSVDITANIANFTGTTDEFFNQLDDHIKYDIIFIDANHDYEYVLRDFNNSIDHANKWILLHDMIPPDLSAAQRVYCSDGYKVLHHILKHTNFQVYPMNENMGFTLVKLPASKIELTEESKNLLYPDFMNFMADKKIYNTVEIENMLKNCF